MGVEDLLHPFVPWKVIDADVLSAGLRKVKLPVPSRVPARSSRIFNSLPLIKFLTVPLTRSSFFEISPMRVYLFQSNVGEEFPQRCEFYGG